MPTRFDFHNFFTPAYERSFTPSNIRAGFAKTGIYPLNKTSVCPEAIVPSRLTDKALPAEPIQKILIEEDLEDSIPNTRIETTNSDPLNDSTSQKQEFTTICNTGSSVTKTDSNVANSLPPKPKKIEVHDILILPKWIPKVTKQRSKRTVPKAICLTPVPPSTSKLQTNNTPQEPKPTRKMSVSATVKGKIKSVTQKKRKLSLPEDNEDDWICHTCDGLYSNDVSSKNGAEWITCSFCTLPYHVHCQSQDIPKGSQQQIFMCDVCSVADSDDDDQ